jgi:hypothetical protein
MSNASANASIPSTNAGSAKCRKSYSFDFNSSVLAQLRDGVSIKQVARENNLNDRLVRRWKNQDEIPVKMKAMKKKSFVKKRFPGGGKKTSLSADRKDEIYQWVLDARHLKYVIKRKNMSLAQTHESTSSH